MRGLLVALLVVLGSPGMAGSIFWPDESIPVPDLVRLYIVGECADHARRSGEPVEPCIAGEIGGYRATVMMLVDPDTGARAAERYRACAAGLGAYGGRFHRRRAECIGRSLRIIWRFGDDTLPT